jgi:hypothetical protein
MNSFLRIGIFLSLPSGAAALVLATVSLEPGLSAESEHPQKGQKACTSAISLLQLGQNICPSLALDLNHNEERSVRPLPLSCVVSPFSHDVNPFP